MISPLSVFVSFCRALISVEDATLYFTSFQKCHSVPTLCLYVQLCQQAWTRFKVICTIKIRLEMVRQIGLNIKRFFQGEQVRV